MTIRTWLENLQFARNLDRLHKERQRAPRRKAASSLRLGIEALEDRFLPSTFTVLNILDSGAGSFRNALTQVNSDAGTGTDTINFAISGAGVHTIAPLSALPAITHSVVIDGTSQAGYAVGIPVIELNGSGAGNSTPGLTLNAVNSTIEGLMINRFSGAGIEVSGTSNDVIQGNVIGTGTTAQVGEGNGGTGIQFARSSTNTNITIGGSTAAARNVISGNSGAGIDYGNSFSSGTTIQGNFIGTDASGTKPLGNTSAGIEWDSSASPNVIADNVISANQGNGVVETTLNPNGTIAEDVIQGNFIGTDVTGTQPLGNAKEGVSVALSSASILLSGNVISANGTGGLDLGSFYGFTTVQGNKIGTDLTGTQPLGNLGVGVSGRINVTIGGPAADGNVIADNAGTGVVVIGSGDSILSNSIFGNKGLGIDAGGNGVTLNTPGGVQNFPVLGSAFGFGSSTAIQGTLNSRQTTTFDVQFFANPTADPSGFGQGQTYLGSMNVTTDANGNAAFQVILPVGVPAGEVVSATATDPYSNTSEFSSDIAVLAAKPPVAAVGDAYNTDVKTALSVAAPGVLANDISIDNGVFTAALVSGAAHGTVVLNPNGSFTYTPKNGFTGTDTFTYVDVEGTATSYATTVSISVNAKTQVVTNILDSGPGSLRQALIIADLSNTADADKISFAIPGTGPFVIQPLTALPVITHPTVIDGYTQTGSRANTMAVGDNAVIMIQLDGTLAGGVDGLAVSAGSSTVKGLSLTNFGSIYKYLAGDPIDLTGAGNDVIQGNFLGLNPAGLDTFGNAAEALIVSGAGNNQIGGTSPDARNVIDSYNGDMSISGPNNSVQGNYFNSDLSGTQFQYPTSPYHTSGIVLADATNTTIGGTKAGAGNVILTELSISGTNGGPGSTGTLIQGNDIGVDVTGSVGFGGCGVIINQGSNTVIGGTSAGARNLITNISVNNVSGVLIQGNYIGTAATGLKSLGLNGDGIDLVSSTEVTIGGSVKGAGNLISGHSGVGISDSADNYYGVTSSENVIQGNLIGTDATGTIALPNVGGGISVAGSGDLIGGTTVRARNVISGNGQWGVTLGDGDFNNLVEGNFIGTDITGAKALGNGADGIQIQGYAESNTIGGPAKGAGNVISGNGQTGVSLGSGSFLNLVEGNFIGTDITGTNPLGNASDGVQVQGAENTIGGTANGAGNIIADNGDAGVDLVSVYNAILSNSIFGNAHLGIDLGDDGVTANTPGGHNYPVLSVVMAHGGLIGVAGTLNGTPETSYTVQFFASAAADPSGYGQGQNYLGSVTVLTDTNGNAAFTARFKSQPGTVVSATATDPNGHTSEFSADVVPVDMILLVQNDVYRVDENSTLTVATPGVQANDIVLSNKPTVSSVVVKPFHGKLTLAADGSFTYSPTAGYIGIDTFTYTDTVGGQTANAQVTITVAPKTFVVTNTSDSGAGSLRQAILSADLATSAPPDTIQFAITLTGPFLIQPATPLPALSHATIIDGYSQPGASPNTLAQGDNAVILIQLDGTNVGGVDGLQISGGLSTVQGLDITGFGIGIHEFGDSGDVIQGNFIGTDLQGANPLGNSTGIELDGSANTIGGTTAGARNLISGNYGDGVLITGNGNVAEGNYIGSDLQGVNPLGNYNGIELDGSTNTVGGTTAGARNLISGNYGDGVLITGNGNLAEGNYIGTDVTGTHLLGNAGNGINIESSSNTVGGTAPGAGNSIAFNASDGVLIDSGMGNAVQHNSIFSNGGLAIELIDAGNNSQAAPVLTAAVVSSGSISGTLTSTANTTFTVELFSNPSGTSQGQTYLGSITVTTDSTGLATFTASCAVPLAPGQVITATATDPFGDTSEFSSGEVVT